MDSAGLEILGWGECFELLARVPIGRIVYTDQALPAIQPVNFVVDGQSVVIRTAAGGRLAFRATGTVVAFEVDDFADGHIRSGWSVVAVGRAVEVTDEQELVAVRQLGPHLWVGGAKEYYLRVAIEIISGRRLVTS